jgi:hypothetical protein
MLGEGTSMRHGRSTGLVVAGLLFYAWLAVCSRADTSVAGDPNRSNDRYPTPGACPATPLAPLRCHLLEDTYATDVVADFDRDSPVDGDANKYLIFGNPVSNRLNLPPAGRLGDGRLRLPRWVDRKLMPCHRINTVREAIGWSGANANIWRIGEIPSGHPEQPSCKFSSPLA